MYPPDVHKIMGKWGSLHWYCTTCELAITMFCKSDSTHFDKTGKPDNISARGLRLEDMMTILEERMDKVIASQKLAICEILCPSPKTHCSSTADA